MREQLRQATGAIHSRLDETVGSQPLSNDDAYAAFLAAQYRARRVVERALDLRPPMGVGPPPSQVDLLLGDLREYGIEPQPIEQSLALTSSAEALGAAWVLAGSSLGNRAILSRRRKAGLQGPERFLSDTQLASYFSEVLRMLDAEHDDWEVRQAISGALKAFTIFEAAFCKEAMVPVA